MGIGSIGSVMDIASLALDVVCPEAGIALELAHTAVNAVSGQALGQQANSALDQTASFLHTALGAARAL